jgi:hypothetical protein
MRLRTRLGVGTAVMTATLALGAGPALADAGAPGTTFPEQPGGHVATGCGAVLTNPGSGEGGHAALSPTALAIVGGLIEDACLENG